MSVEVSHALGRDLSVRALGVQALLPLCHGRCKRVAAPAREVSEGQSARPAGGRAVPAVRGGGAGRARGLPDRGLCPLFPWLRVER